MLIRIDISYPHLMHSGEQFPAAPATLFQAVVAANGHRLDSVTDLLEALEHGTCVRIVQHSDATPIRFRTAVPRLPKVSEIKNIKSAECHEPLLKPQNVFPLEPMPVHLSYYFQLGEEFTLERLTDVLRVNVLGRGESVTMSHVSIVDELSNERESGIVWEPSAAGRQLNIPYAGFLKNLRLLHDSRQSAFGAPQQSAKFAVRGSVAPYYSICYDLLDEDGDTFSYPQESMSDISAMMRHAIVGALKDKSEEAYVAGHAPIHPFYIPIPTIGHEHADGNIRRVIVAEPISGTGLLQRNLSVITSLRLVNESGERVCRAVRRTDADYVLKQYLQPATVFRTVTPMVVDRNGGQQRVGKRISALIQKAGYPEPTRISFNRTWWSGKLPITVARCLAHAEVEFPVAVSGVVFAGLGSGYGIGLFYANRSGV
jgi:CRISPR-associated protein Csb2